MVTEVCTTTTLFQYSHSQYLGDFPDYNSRAILRVEETPASPTFVRFDT